MLFSIVIPVYNAEKYLGECIDSILNQTCQDFEVILVNDGSKDNSEKILRDYSSRYGNKIKVITQKNSGQVVARKTGIDASSGEYVLSIDADDCLRCDALEIISERIKKANSPDVVFFRCSIYNDYSIPLSSYVFKDGEVFEGDRKNIIYNLLLSTSNLNSFCFKAYKSSLIKSIDFSNSATKIRNGEDLLQALEIITQAKQLIYCDQILYYYRIVADSVSRRFVSTLFLSRKIIHQELNSYVQKWGLEDKKYVDVINLRVLKEMTSVIINVLNADKKTALEKLKEISTDEWFKSLYKNTNKKSLSKKSRLVLRLVYKKRINLVCFILKLKGCL